MRDKEREREECSAKTTQEDNVELEKLLNETELKLNLLFLLNFIKWISLVFSSFSWFPLFVKSSENVAFLRNFHLRNASHFVRVLSSKNLIKCLMLKYKY